MNSINDSSLNDKLPKLDRFVFYFLLIDVLFLPYFWLLAIPLSMPVCIFFVVYRWKYLIQGFDGLLFKFLILSIMLSSFFGVFLYNEILYENVKFFLHYFYAFSTFFIFKKYKIESHKKIFSVFVLFIAITVITYYLDKSIYSQIVGFWNSRSGSSIASIYSFFEGYRYSFIWSDPNNIAYMACALYFFFLIYVKSNFYLKFGLFLMLLLILFAAMSSGGWYSLIIGIFAYVILGSSNFKISKIYFTSTEIVAVCCTLTLISASLMFVDWDLLYGSVINNNVVSEAIDRFNDNSGESRTVKWLGYLNELSLANYLTHIFIGYGGVTIINGQFVAPHNGHFYWILGYGFLSYVAFVVFIFRKRVGFSLYKMIWLIPILVGFTINLMIGEAKLVVLLMFLLAYSSNLNAPAHLISGRGRV